MVVKLITSDVHILKTSLEKRIRPNYDLLKGILGSHTEVAIAIGSRSSGDRMLCTLYPRSVLKDPAQFNKTIDLLKKMGFDVSKTVFTLGVNVLSALCKATWDRKFQLYRSLGWSDDDILTAFKKHPFCMLLSDEKIKHNFGFFAKELQWAPSFVATRPVLLFFSFENTITPRYKIFRILESKGLIRRNGGFSTFLWLPKKKFLNQYVIKFADQVPELLELYKDKLQLSRVEADS
ncbi:uncharacterized protein LOC110093129 [Dendrobium catenatum]|uniref:uncharacterized protein LOC110093129 n=1 Tax=Dendrobium catenatum TaxID=906689 RepID=UPI00109FA2DB|nr:uncharacterized protein LOC110093129 [Dendrobium catenatum]